MRSGVREGEPSAAHRNRPEHTKPRSLGHPLGRAASGLRIRVLLEARLQLRRLWETGFQRLLESALSVSRRLAPHRDQQDHDNGSEQDGRSKPHAGHLSPPLRARPQSSVRRFPEERPAVNPYRSRIPRPQLCPSPEFRCAGMPPRSASQTLRRVSAMRSPPEEGSIELSRLRGRQSWLREQVDDLIGQVPLPGRKGRRVSIVPAQPRTDMGVEPHFLARDLVGEPVQVSHLLEQGLELHVVDRHLGSETSLERGRQARRARPVGGETRRWIVPLAAPYQLPTTAGPQTMQLAPAYR